jgi:NAD(P)-dependent dehydrogenase (short-subunit alcohol dehydrogenase family)
MSVEDSVVVVTGGAAGIGRYIARNFALNGAKVVIADVRPMDELIDELSTLGADVVGISTDVTDEDSVKGLFDATYKRHGRIDTLINNAAIVTHFHLGAPRWSRIRDMNRDFFSKVIDVNLVGTFLCCKHAIPYMESLNAGHIVNFGQGNLRRSERKPNIGMCTYTTSKIAIRAFTIGLAEEVREFNVCVLSMSPTVARSGPVQEGPNIPGAGGGILTDDSPEWSLHQSRKTQSVSDIGDNYLLAAQADISFSGAQVAVRDGKLVLLED